MKFKQEVIYSIKVILIVCVFGNIILFFYLPIEAIPSQFGIRWLQRDQGKTTEVLQKFTMETMRKDNSYNTEASEIKQPSQKVTFPTNGVTIKNISKQGKQAGFITIKPPKGKLGNQMFQLAVLLGLANKTHLVPFLSMPFPELDLVFDLPAKLYRRIGTSSFNFFTQKEQVGSSDLESIDQRHNWTLDGYFQFYKIFSHIEKEVRETFKFKPLFTKAAKEFLAQNVPENQVKVGLHVRRGDYISGYQRKLGRHTADMDFYNRAIGFYRMRYRSNVTFVVVSDDKRWCHENLLFNDTVISYNRNKGVDLAILSLCDHSILSVGTYSWWGAWLAGGTVVCYCQEFTPGSQLEQQFVEEDYYPVQWIKI